jgi:hypothetical protein
MSVDEDTELVTCRKCGKVMSGFKALMVLVKEWESMRYENDEWKRMRTEQANARKHEEVKRVLRQMQYIELPEEEPARSYWTKLTEALGKEPYALFRRGKGRGEQWMIMSEDGRGRMDADSIIEMHEREKAASVQPAIAPQTADYKREARF